MHQGDVLDPRLVVGADGDQGRGVWDLGRRAGEERGVQSREQAAVQAVERQRQLSAQELRDQGRPARPAAWVRRYGGGGGGDREFLFLFREAAAKQKKKLSPPFPLSFLIPLNKPFLFPSKPPPFHQRRQEADHRDRQEGQGRQDLQQPVRGREARRGRARGAEEALERKERTRREKV